MIEISFLIKMFVIIEWFQRKRKRKRKKRMRKEKEKEKRFINVFYFINTPLPFFYISSFHYYFVF